MGYLPWYPAYYYCYITSATVLVILHHITLKYSNKNIYLCIEKLLWGVVLFGAIPCVYNMTLWTLH